MSKTVDEILAEEGAASENGEVPDVLPAQVKVSRPNLGRPTVVSVRLSAAEHASLQAAAARANLPVSTLLRIWVLDRLRAEEEGSSGTVAERLARLEQVVFSRPA
jgi:hypothetical protein